MTRAKKKSRKAPPASRKKAEKAPLDPQVMASAQPTEASTRRSDDTAPIDDELAIEAAAVHGADDDDDALPVDLPLAIDSPVTNGATTNGTTNGAVGHEALESDTPDGLETDTHAPTTPSSGATPAAVDLDQLLKGDDSDTAEGPDDPGASDAADADAVEPARELSQSHLEGLLEALVFASDKPVKTNELARLASAPARQVKDVMGELRAFHATRGIVLDEIAGGWLFRTNAQYAPFVRELAGGRPVKLSRAQIETLAIAAYRQPITRPEIDEIRGVDSGATLKLLLERDLLRILGKKDEPGRPLLYGTTAHFLEFFNMKSLKDLPTLREFTELSDESRKVAETELGEVLPDLHIPVDRPAALTPDESALGESEPGTDDPGEDDAADSERETLPITSAVAPEERDDPEQSVVLQERDDPEQSVDLEERDDPEEHADEDRADEDREETDADADAGDDVHPGAPSAVDSDADEDV